MLAPNVSLLFCGDCLREPSARGVLRGVVTDPWFSPKFPAPANTLACAARIRLLRASRA